MRFSVIFVAVAALVVVITQAAPASAVPAAHEDVYYPGPGSPRCHSIPGAKGQIYTGQE